MSSTPEYLPLGCLGKLPFEREHFRVNLGYPTARRLDQWTQEGRHAAMLDSGEGQPATMQETSQRRFLIGEDGSAELLAGVIRPSADLGQQRQYPFALFAPIPRRQYGRHYALLPLGLEPVWEAIEDLWGTLATAVSRESFLEVISAARIPAPTPVAEARDRYESLKGESAGLAILDDSFAEVLAKLKKGEGKGQAGVRLGLPVSRDLSQASFDVAFWLDLLNRQFLLKRFEPSFFVDATPGDVDRDALLIFGILAAEDYPVVMGGAPSRVEVLRPAQAATGESKAMKSGGELVTYAELLARKFPTSVT